MIVEESEGYSRAENIKICGANADLNLLEYPSQYSVCSSFEMSDHSHDTHSHCEHDHDHDHGHEHDHNHGQVKPHDHSHEVGCFSIIIDLSWPLYSTWIVLVLFVPELLPKIENMIRDR